MLYKKQRENPTEPPLIFLKECVIIIKHIFGGVPDFDGDLKP